MMRTDPLSGTTGPGAGPGAVLPDELHLRNARRRGADERIAVVVRGGLIAWIGADTDAPVPPDGATQIDANGALVLPGFCDSHLHLFAGGVSLQRLNLAAIHDVATLATALAAFSAGLPAAEMLCAYGANYDLVGPHRRPDRHVLDKILPDHAVYIAATDGHCAWANTAALQRAGILGGATVDPGSNVVMGPDGLASGELLEFSAMDRVSRMASSAGRENCGLMGVEPHSTDATARAFDKATLLAATLACAEAGITSVCNMDGNIYQAELLGELADEGRLVINVSLPMTLVPGMTNDRRRALYDQAAQPARGKLRFGGVKMFMDGVFDTWTAFRTDDYPDRPGFRGVPLFDPSEFARNCIEADACGLQIATHAVGDGAVRATLDGYAAARKANGARDSRHRVEHIDMLHPDDLHRLRALGVIASMQPVHPPGSSGLPLEPTVSIMGANRWSDAFAWRCILRSGAVIAFGTDWPISPLSPFNALHSALARQPWEQDVPDQRLTPGECLTAYVEGGAHAMFADTRRGRLDIGQEADLILVEGTVENLAVSPTAATLRLTVASGRIVYRA